MIIKILKYIIKKATTGKNQREANELIRDYYLQVYTEKTKVRSEIIRVQ